MTEVGSARVKMQARQAEAEWRSRLEDAGQGSEQILARERRQWELLKGNMQGEMGSLSEALNRAKQQAAEDVEAVERWDDDF